MNAPQERRSPSLNAVRVLIELMEAMRDRLNAPEIPAQQVLTFCHVADRAELPMAELLKLTGLAQSSVSRTVAKLGQGESPREPGFGLIEAYEDPYFRRRKLVRLTPRGKELAKELQRVLVGLERTRLS